MSLRIPVYGQQDITWSYFLLQTARGSVRVPDWIQRAMLAVVANRVGKDPEEVDEDDLAYVLRYLPDDADAVLWRLLLALDEEPPPLEGGVMRLDEASVMGSHREPVSQVDLLHDVAVMMQLDFGPEAFHACLDAIDDSEAWDARGAVGAMVYLMLMHFH